MSKKKWYMFAALALGGSLFQFGGGGCSGFGSGFLSQGWPGNNRWLNLAIDILNEELFG